MTDALRTRFREVVSDDAEIRAVTGLAHQHALDKVVRVVDNHAPPLHRRRAFPFIATNCEDETLDVSPKGDPAREDQRRGPRNGRIRRRKPGQGPQAAPGHRHPRSDAAHRGAFRQHKGPRRCRVRPRPDHRALPVPRAHPRGCGYQGGPRVAAAAPRPVEIIKHTDAGFVVQPKRWVVERTFARACINRRLARDSERAARTVGGFFQIPMIKLMARRIARYRDS